MARSLGADARVGTELAGYRIERVLGRGGMGVVYLAEQLRLKRKVALKLLAPELARDERFRERFLRESELAAGLDHPNICPIHDAGEAQGVLYLAMRYVEGSDLGTLLEEEERLEPARALALLEPVAAALDQAHARGLVHRDVKPSNVLLAREGAAEHVYLSDFGLTGRTDEGDPVERVHLSGSPDYVAPEQIEGKAPHAAADVYSLACVLYHCLVGEPPFLRDSRMELLWAHFYERPPRVTGLRPELPTAIDEVIAKALAKEPEERYRGCAELLVAAREALSLAPLKRARQWPLLIALAASVAAGAAVAGLLLARGDGAGDAGRVLVRIDPATSTVAARIETRADRLAVDGQKVWVSDFERQIVARIDARTGEVVRTIPARGTRGGPVEIAVGGGRLLLLTGKGFGLARLVDTSTGKEGPARACGLVLEGGRLAPGPLAYGAGGAWDYTESGSVVRFAPSPSIPGATALQRVSIELTPDEIPELASAASFGPSEFRVDFPLAVGEGAVWFLLWNGRVIRIDPGSMQATGSFTLGFRPAGIAAAAGALWVTDPVRNAVHKIDPATGRREPTDIATVGLQPRAIVAGNGSIWVANTGDGTVSRIDPSTGDVVATIAVGGRPYQIAAGGGAVWATIDRVTVVYD